MENETKKLYNDADHSLTDEGIYLDNAVAHALQPVLDYWFKRGFSPREVYSVVSFCVMDLVLTQVLGWREELPSDLKKRLHDEEIERQIRLEGELKPPE